MIWRSHGHDTHGMVTGVHVPAFEIEMNRGISPLGWREFGRLRAHIVTWFRFSEVLPLLWQDLVRAPQGSILHVAVEISGEVAFHSQWMFPKGGVSF